MKCRWSMTSVMKTRVWGSDTCRQEFLGLRDKVKEQRELKTAMRSCWQKWPGGKRNKEGGIWIWQKDANKRQPKA